MTQKNSLTKQPNQPVSLTKSILVGAGIALMVISFFLFMAGEGQPEWGKFWMIRPLIIVPLAGTMGGAVYHFMDHLSHEGVLNKIVAVILSLVIYIIALWLGIILGLDGTLWD